MPETRPDLGGIKDEQQRTLGMSYWYLWRIVQERPDTLSAPVLAAVTGPHGLLSCLKAHMQPETAHQIALAEGRYWRETSQID